MSDSLPLATLHIDSFMVIPPKPASIVVKVGKKMVAVVPLDEFKAAARRLEQMEVKIEMNENRLGTNFDPVVEEVRADLLSRSAVGIAKYGVTLARNDLELRDWLQHAYEETLDQANYLKRAIMEIDNGKG